MRILKWLVFLGAGAVVAGLLLLGGLYLYLEPSLPKVEQLRDVQFQQPLRIYAANGDLMAVYGAKRRDPIDIRDVPEQFRNAFIAAEDNRFYEHPGVDWMGIVRAAWHLVLTGRKTQGGSTITMQVARNFFLSPEKTYLRKIREIFVALQIDHRFSKNRILQLYLNKIYLGEGAYGIGAAAQTYYGKPVGKLTLAQRATIAGLPRAPSYYDPIQHPARARHRRNYVLRQMLENGMIGHGEYARARAEPISATQHAAPIQVHAPYAADMARREAVRRLGPTVYTEGYRVYTTVDAQEQRAATRALRHALLQYSERHGYEGPVTPVDGGHVPTGQALRGLMDRARAAGAGTPGEDMPDHATALPTKAAASGGSGVPGPARLDSLLSDYEPVGNLEPALVLSVRDDRTIVYRRGGRIDDIPWDSMKWAAPRAGNGHVGKHPDAPADVLAPGDVIYVVPARGHPGVRLAQVPKANGALVALDPHDGAIQALVGGFSYQRSQFNRVTEAHRQPGSGFKPFVYSAALHKGYTAATLINDAPLVFKSSALEDQWKPQNYSGKVFGPTRLREGLVHSRNLVSLRVLYDIGVPYAIRYVQRFGFRKGQLPNNLTLALGSGSVTPLQLARGYAVFANMGYRIDPYLVTRIATSDGHVVYRADPAVVCHDPCASTAGHGSDPAAGGAPVAPSDMPQGRVNATLSPGGTGTPSRSGKLAGVGVPDLGGAGGPRRAPRVISRQNAYIVRSFMRDVARRGTGKATRVLGRDDIAGKTGTSDHQVDAWFSGFNSSVVTTAWVGRDDNRSLGHYETGAQAALPMWIEFMRTALAGTPRTWPSLPPGMVTVRIDPDTGRYAGPGTKNAMFEIFRQANAPKPRAAHSGSNSTGSDKGSLF